MTYKIVVESMKCMGCVNILEHGIKTLASVESVDIDFATKQITVDGDISFRIIQDKIQELGYEAELIHSE
ncbi:MAG: heavy-metal-associated domain-containing protein [bacterium]